MEFGRGSLNGSVRPGAPDQEAGHRFGSELSEIVGAGRIFADQGLV